MKMPVSVTRQSQRTYSASGQAVVSPISGYVKNLLVKEGDYVSVGQPLVSVTQNRKSFPACGRIPKSTILT